MRTKKGYTLTEMLIIVALLGIITSYSVMKYRDYISRTYVVEAYSLVESFRPLVTLNLQTPFCAGASNKYGNYDASTLRQNISVGKYGTMRLLYDYSNNSYYSNSDGLTPTIDGKKYTVLIPNYASIPENLRPDVMDGRECFLVYKFNNTRNVPFVIRDKEIRFKFLKNKILAVEKNASTITVSGLSLLDTKYLPKDTIFINASYVR